MALGASGRQRMCSAAATAIFVDSLNLLFWLVLGCLAFILGLDLKNSGKNTFGMVDDMLLGALSSLFDEFISSCHVLGTRFVDIVEISEEGRGCFLLGFADLDALVGSLILEEVDAVDAVVVVCERLAAFLLFMMLLLPFLLLWRRRTCQIKYVRKLELSRCIENIAVCIGVGGIHGLNVVAMVRVMDVLLFQLDEKKVSLFAVPFMRAEDAASFR